METLLQNIKCKIDETKTGILLYIKGDGNEWFAVSDFANDEKISTLIETLRPHFINGESAKW
jgi:hypothetical protein